MRQTLLYLYNIQEKHYHGTLTCKYKRNTCTHLTNKELKRNDVYYVIAIYVLDDVEREVFRCSEDGLSSSTFTYTTRLHCFILNYPW